LSDLALQWCFRVDVHARAQAGMRKLSLYNILIAVRVLIGGNESFYLCPLIVSFFLYFFLSFFLSFFSVLFGN
jgi:hypothetical protein